MRSLSQKTLSCHHQRSKYTYSHEDSYARDNVSLGTVIPCFIRSAKNCSDVMTKSTSSIIFKNHNSTLMGHTELPRSNKLVETTRNEYIPCQFCSGTLPITSEKYFWALSKLCREPTNGPT